MEEHRGSGGGGALEVRSCFPMACNTEPIALEYDSAH